MLYDEIRRIFEGFVRASVEAIEQRDPTTSGHSRRVAELTVGLAQRGRARRDGPVPRGHLHREDLRELEYASLLHDFGKIGVREQVLVKAKKLYDARARAHSSSASSSRSASLEVEILTRKLRAHRARRRRDDARGARRELERAARRAARRLAAIESANEPTVLEGRRLRSASRRSRAQTYSDLAGEVQPLLTPAEVTSLSA